MKFALYFFVGMLIGICLCILTINAFFNIKNIPNVVMTTYNEIVEIKNIINKGFNCNLSN